MTSAVTLTIAAPCCGEPMEVGFEPGSPAVMYTSSGDGEPEDPPQVNYTSICPHCGVDIFASGRFVDAVVQRAAEAYDAEEGEC